MRPQAVLKAVLRDLGVLVVRPSARLSRTRALNSKRRKKTKMMNNGNE